MNFSFVIVLNWSLMPGSSSAAGKAFLTGNRYNRVNSTTPIVQAEIPVEGVYRQQPF